MPNNQNFAAIILAAGQGKRMKSKTSKVLMDLGGKPLIQKILDMLYALNPIEIVLVANAKNFAILKKIVNKKIKVVIQKEKKGTLGAAIAGLRMLLPNIENVAILYGDDTAFYRPQTLLDVYRKHMETESVITFISLELENPQGLGRVIRKNGKVLGIVEEKDATENQKKVKEVNNGVYFFNKSWLVKNSKKVKPSPITTEYYLTDMIDLAIQQKRTVEAYKLSDESQWHGINTPKEFEEAKKKLRTKLHFMGIAGSGAAAVAAIAARNGFEVDGCDLEPNSSYANSLQGIEIKKGHDPLHLKIGSKLIVSPAILKNDPHNPELKKAKKENIQTLTWQQFQADFLQKGKFVIAVAGTYGKSTTTAMISKILIDQNLDPTCEIGAEIKEWKTNFKVGSSKYYICEADEYKNNFLYYRPDIAIILNLAWDHPDFFRNHGDLIKSYVAFINRIKKNGVLIIKEDATFEQVIKKIRKDIKIIKISDFGNLNLSIIGKFRKENSDAALTLGQYLGLEIDIAKTSIENFQGLTRRLEYKGSINSIKFYDDYAVQPYTIKTTANALKEKFPAEKVYLVLEPHTFSRVETFFDDFIKSLNEVKVDKILITDIFAAREKGHPLNLAKALTKAIGAKAHYVSNLESAALYINQHLKAGIVCSMGAGKAYMLWDIMSAEK